MKTVLQNDISIKIVSVLTAILLWIFVINADNPYRTKPIDVPVKILNRDTLNENGLFLKNENNMPSVIRINVTGRKDVIETLSASDFEAKLDLSGIANVKDKKLKIDEPHCLKKGVSIMGYSPHSIDIELENVLNSSFPVTVVTTGIPKQGYKVLKTYVSSETIALEDQESIINKIGSIKAIVDVGNADSTIARKVQCKVYNRDGKEITAFKNLSVEVRVEIGKTVPVIAVIKGKPAKDYIEVQRTVTPQTVVIAGDSQHLGGVSYIETEPLNITNSIASINTSVPLKLPDGVKLAEGPKDATVNITIVKLENKSFQLNKNDISVNMPADSGLKYEIINENINATLKGKQDDIAGITTDILKPFIDLTGLDEGTHKVRLNITLPAQVKLVKEIDIEVRLTKV